MINILLCGNSGYIFDGALTTLLSITKHCFEPLNVYLFTMDATKLNPKFTPITDEEAKYIELSLNGDEDARNILIEHNLRLVVFLAKKYDNTGTD